MENIILQKMVKEQKLTCYQLSKRSGVPYSTIHNLLHGKKKISIISSKNLYLIARSLKTTSEFLLKPVFYNDDLKISTNDTAYLKNIDVIHLWRTESGFDAHVNSSSFTVYPGYILIEYGCFPIGNGKTDIYINPKDYQDYSYSLVLKENGTKN